MSDRMNLYNSAKEHRISEKSEVLCFFFCRMEEIMATESSIMDSNSFKEEYASMLSPKTREMISKREKYLGGAYRLFYRKPLNIVRGEGDYLWDDEGNKYLDMYNNVAGVGHCNPAVVNAVTEQMKTLNTHTRYLHEKFLITVKNCLHLCLMRLIR